MCHKPGLEGPVLLGIHLDDIVVAHESGGDLGEFEVCKIAPGAHVVTGSPLQMAR